METQTNELIDEFLNLPSIAERYLSFARRAEDAGHPHLAHFFRAVAVSDSNKEKLVRMGVLEHAESEAHYFVCPHCGLIVIPEPPEKCPVDDTPGVMFQPIA